MKRFTTIALALTFALGTAAFAAGCKSDDDKFCEELRRIDKDSFDDCEEDALPEAKKACGDKFGEAVECLEGAEDKKAAGECYQICK